MSAPDTPPSMAELIDWIEGRLDAEAAADVGRAVAAGDATVTATVDWLRRFLEVSRSVPLHPPPPLISQTLRQHFDAWARARAILDTEPDLAEALLVFDSRQDLVGVGARGGDHTSDAVHLAFSSSVADLLLDVGYLGSGRVRLEGQVLPRDPTSAVIFAGVATGPGFVRRTVDGDELGRFTLDDVPETVSEIQASNGEVGIVAALRLDRS